jgi:diacylglycerol kinase family enzyme
VHDVAAAEAPVTVFLNAGAGLSATAAAELQQELGEQRFRVVPIRPSEVRQHVAEAVAARAEVVGIAGGDGTMHAAASALVGSRTALLPVPTGTLNNFARRAGIETPRDSVRALEGRAARLLPVGAVNDRIFLNTLTFGEYSRVVRMRERYRHLMGKWPAAALAFAITALSMRRFDTTISTPERTLTRRTPFVWIGVGWGSFPQVHEAPERRRHPDLEVAIVRSASRTAATAFVLRMGIRMLGSERPIRDPALEVLNTRTLTVDSHRLIDATADGEVLRLRPPLDVGVRDDALLVMGLWDPADLPPV